MLTLILPTLFYLLGATAAPPQCLSPVEEYVDEDVCSSDRICGHTSLLQTSLTLAAPAKVALVAPITPVVQPPTVYSNHSSQAASMAQTATAPVEGKPHISASLLLEVSKLQQNSSGAAESPSDAGSSDSLDFGSGNTAVFAVCGLLVLGVCVIFMLSSTSGSNDEWSPAQDLLTKRSNLAPQNAANEPGLAMIPAFPVAGAVSSTSAGAAPTANSSFFQSLSAKLSAATSMPGGIMGSTATHLMPETIVQTPGGQQFFIDGNLSNQEQIGNVPVWRSASEHDRKMVLSIVFCESETGTEGHQNGVALELPSLGCRMPVAFINTQFARPRPGHHGVIDAPHVQIFNTFAEGLDFKKPFARAERGPSGITLRHMHTGEILCSVMSGGYNTDFGNIVDKDGRLIATLSNRGHSLTGLGMVRGAWKENLRVVHIAQGTDLTLIICAIISAAKLS